MLNPDNEPQSLDDRLSGCEPSTEDTTAVHTALSPEELQKIASVAFKRTFKLKPIIGYTLAEVKQDALIGVWQASLQDTVYRSKLHRFHTLVLAGYRRVLDARSARYRVSGGGEFEVPLAEEQEASGADYSFDSFGQVDSTADSLYAKQLYAKLETLDEPLPTIAALLIEGYQAKEIAAFLGISPAAISRHRAKLQSYLRRISRNLT